MMYRRSRAAEPGCRSKRVHFRTRLLTIAVSAIAMAGATLPTAAPALAVAPTPDAQQTLDPAALFLMQKYRLTAAEATDRLVQQDRATSLQDNLEATFGDAFGGLWIDQASGGLTVVGVRPGQERTVRDLAAARQVTRLRVVPVARTVGQLRATQAEVQRALATTPGSDLRLGGVYLPTNQVNVKIQAGDPAARARGEALAAELNARHLGQLRFVSSAGVPMTASCIFSGEFNVFCDPPLRGGVGITASGVRCSAAFNVRSTSDGKRYLLSAGHCNTSGTWQTRFANLEIHDIGPTHNAFFNSSGDGMIIRLNNPTGWNPKPWVFVTGNSGTTRDETYDINADGGTTFGMAVCMTGRRDGTQCGEVIDTDTPGVVVDHVAEVSGGCIRGGDSGGSVYKNHTAYGLVHGGTFPGGDNNFCSITWFYQGIRGAMSALNVRLVTTSNP